MTDLLQTRRAPTWLLVAVIASLVPWSCCVNLWFAEQKLYRPLYQATAGLLSPALQVGLPSVILYVAMLRLGGLRGADFGWRRGHLRAAAVATSLVWLISNVVAVLANFDTLALDEALAQRPLVAAGRLLGQLFGNALLEETLYRGFCLVQFLLLLRGRPWLAALLSAICFAVPHIPNRIYLDGYADAGDVVFDMTQLLCSGLFLAWVYLRTRNLWWLVGLHSLANAPSLLVHWDVSVRDGKVLVSVAGVALTLLWPRLFVRRLVPGS